MKLSTHLGHDGDPVRAAKQARLLEMSGIDVIWV